MTLAVVVLASMTVGGPSGTQTRWLPAIIVVVVVALITDLTRRSRSERRAYEAELARLAAADAVAAERLALARELHDLVSHGLGFISVRASVARRVAGRAAGHAGNDGPMDALADIEQAAREATNELRRMLDVLQAGGGAPLHPTPGLDDLDDLVTLATRQGLTVVRTGDADGTSAGAALVAHSVVREALTNTARHCGPTTVELRFRRTPEGLVVDVVDDGPGMGWTAAPGTGRGLSGLRDRVSSVGGELIAGPTGSGWQVSATIPDAAAPVPGGAARPGGQP
ncbi:MAG: sensor histidine kinase [Acidimicrobiales bacterium]